MKKIKKDSEHLSLADCLHSSELRRRLLYTLLLLAIFRIGSYLSIPGIPPEVLTNNPFLTNKLVNMYDLFTGGTLSTLSMFALGIGPYISASIMVQLLSHAIPSLKALKEEGEQGQRKIRKITRYLTLALATMESCGLAKMVAAAAIGSALIPIPLLFVLIVVCLTASTMLTMWISELITEKGIGNGSSILICVGIVARLPLMVHDTWKAVDSHITSPLALTMMLTVLAGAGVAAVALQKSMKKIPVVGGGKIARANKGGVPETQLYLPMNPAGVMPIVFASQVIFFLQAACSFLVEQCSHLHQSLMQDRIIAPSWNALCKNEFFQAATLTLWAESNNVFDYAHWEYYVLYTILILFFSLFYTEMVLPPVEIAENLRRHNRTISGVKPGKATIKFLRQTTQKLAISGAAAVALISLIPTQMAQLTQIQSLLGFGSTSLIILTGVVLDTQRQINACVAGSRTHRKYLLAPPKADKQIADLQDDETGSGKGV